MQGSSFFVLSGKKMYLSGISPVFQFVLTNNHYICARDNYQANVQTKKEHLPYFNPLSLLLFVYSCKTPTKERKRIVLCRVKCISGNKKQAAVFERFTKLDEFAKGTGLGLSICKVITERFNGKNHRQLRRGYRQPLHRDSTTQTGRHCYGYRNRLTKRAHLLVSHYHSEQV